jgi:nitrogen-specific signal transduction histidine kinase
MKTGAIRRTIPYFTGIALVLIIVLAAALLLVLNTFRRNTFRVMEKDGITLMETVIQASRNALTSNEIIDDLIAERLLADALLVDRLEEMTPEILADLSHLHGLLGIDIVDQEGDILSSSRRRRALGFPKDSLGDVLQGIRPTSAFLSEEQDKEQFVLVHQRKNADGAIVVYANPIEIEAQKRDIGIGYLMQRIGGEPRIEYLVLQDDQGIISATRNIRQMSRLSDDSFLNVALTAETPRSRILPFGDDRVLEVVQPFYFKGDFIGLFRMGMDMSEYHGVLRGGQRQIILVLSVVLLFALISAFLILSQQGLRQVTRSFAEIQASTQEILDNLPVGVLWVDTRLRVRAINGAARTILGISRSFEGGYDALFPEDECLLRKALSTREPVMSPRAPFGRKGTSEKRTLSIVSSPVLSAKGKLEGAVAIVEDVTDHVRMEETLRRGKELEALGNLAAGVAHEIRNPLNAISLSVQQLERYSGNVSEEFGSLLRTVRDEIQRLEESIRRFLSLTSPLSLELEMGDLNRLAAGVLDLVAEEAKDRNVRISRRLEELEPLRFDSDKMREVLLNLVRNALQAMPEGGELTFQTLQEEARVVVRVSDTGEGIPEEDLGKIFTPYFTTKSDGSGIGLSYVQRVISAHGGTVSADTEAGKGATFKLEIPNG